MDYQTVRLSKVLDDFVQRMKAGNMGLDIQFQTSESANTIMADPARLFQVLDNLVNNSAKYAPGSVVAITLDWEAVQAHIIVRDTGPGVPEEHLKNIFNRFFRLPEHRETASGTGLGLYICHQIVQAHGGKIWAESAVGEGVAFHICLPRQQIFQSEEDDI